jgi:hypothetical protein
MSGASRPAFVFLAANTPWVYALAQSLERYADVTAVRLVDWLNNARLKPQWPETQSAVRRRAVTMPPGYARTLEPLLRPLMRALVDREREGLRRSTGTEPYVVCTYPYIGRGCARCGDRLVYYNLDDYSSTTRGRGGLACSKTRSSDAPSAPSAFPCTRSSRSAPVAGRRNALHTFRSA